MKVTDFTVSRRNNKTWDYLFPCLALYGERFFSSLDANEIIHVGIDDVYTPRKFREEKNLVYILMKPKFSTDRVLFSMQEFASIVVGRYDYPEVTNGAMLLVRIPEIHVPAYYHFLHGKYSQMYSKDQIGDYFSGKVGIKARAIFLRDEILGPRILAASCNKTFQALNGIRSKYDDLITEESAEREYDLPPVRHEEVFNASRSKKPLFVDPKSYIECLNTE